MKKVIRLTESDLVRLVKRVISEQEVQGKGPVLGIEEAKLIVAAINTAGNFIDPTTFTFKKSLSLRFGRLMTGESPSQSFNYDPNVSKPISFTYQVGDKLNISQTVGAKQYSAVFVTDPATNQPLKMNQNISRTAQLGAIKLG